MSELRSAIEALRTESLADLPDARIEEDFAELQRASELLEVERLRRLAEIERRAIHQRDGHLSAASWLASSFKVAWGSAREQVRVAHSLEEMPETRRALDDGDLSMSAVRVLAAAREVDQSAFRESERELVEAARIHSMQDLQRVASYWRQALERDHALESDEKVRARRRLHASVTFLGMVRVDGDLDPETGETLLTALRAVLDAESRSHREGDERTPAQRRADALGEVCRQWLDLGERPTVAGERPHVTVTVGVDELRDGVDELPGGVGAARDRMGPSSELDHVGPVGREAARRLACDASIRRVVLAGPSEPLDVGRRTPVVPPAMRRSVIVRDRHCRFPSCDRPHTCGATPTTSSTGPMADRLRSRTSCCCAAATTGWSISRVASGWSWRTDGPCSGGRTGRCLRIGRRPSGYPIPPSICSSTSRFSSTAYSMGSSRVIGSMKPFTTMAVASASESPRLIR